MGFPNLSIDPRRIAPSTIMMAYVPMLIRVFSPVRPSAWRNLPGSSEERRSVLLNHRVKRFLTRFDGSRFLLGKKSEPCAVYE